MTSGKSDDSFTFERFSPDEDFKGSAFCLSSLLSEHPSNTKDLSRTQFSECFQKSAERTGILLFTSICKVNETDLQCKYCDESGEITFNLKKGIVSKICALNPLVKHRFNVIDSVVEEIIWNLYRSGVKEFHLFLERKNDENENKKIIVDLGPKRGGEGGGNGSMKLILSSADFIRTNIENFYSDDERYEWRFKEIKERKDTFGWSQDNVDWDRKKNDSLVPPPSFLTFREFTDGVEGSVFLTIKDKGILKYNDQNDLQKVVSSNLKNSFQVYADDKKGYFNNHDGVLALSICCGTRFSHADIGSAHEPHIGDELLGVFMTLLIDERFIEKLKVVSENIYLSSGTIKYILLQNLAREKSYDQQQDRKELEKQAQMLRLLEKPLNSLTDALNKTQEDTQSLRSILYDPHRGIFSVAPLVCDYFEEGRDCRFGDVWWKALHKPDEYNKEEDDKPFAASATCAAIICHIFGQRELGKEKPSDLFWKMFSLLETEDSAFGELKGALEMILWECDKEKKQFLISQMRTNLLSLDKNKKANYVVEALKRLKRTVFTPFKDQTKKTPLLPLALIVWDNKYKGSLINGIVNTDVVKSITEMGGLDVFEASSLPVPRYSMVLSLISGVLEYAKHEKKAVINIASVIQNEGKGIEIIFDSTQEVFEKADMHKTYALMTSVKKDKLFTSQGNFRKPFLDFAVTTDGEVTDDTEKWSVRKGGFDTVILAINKTFSFMVTRVEGGG